MKPVLDSYLLQLQRTVKGAGSSPCRAVQGLGAEAEGEALVGGVDLWLGCSLTTEVSWEIVLSHCWATALFQVE